ncbi:hypothetical protein [Nocardia sp. NBC_01329]|uniref:hypothetical protein n=1 Tax=Nocardia sp. NBC_01329 TaxID=2903594 RepID=UPI002E1450EF|nr:hypothetical protein OG405_13495 [Nocardia sp. NBC_01329]
MTRDSSPDLLVLHAVRILGFADTPVIAYRFRLDPAETEEILLDAQAYGWIQRAAFADLHGWSLTESGRIRNEQQLHEELAAIGKADRIRGLYRDFLPLNARLQRACTDWQLRPTPDNALYQNDHSDTAWDTRILDELAAIGSALHPLADRMGAILARLSGYEKRFDAALRRVGGGDHGWVDRTDVDSCHRVWFELHEDLVATLGIDRRTEI